MTEQNAIAPNFMLSEVPEHQTFLANHGIHINPTTEKFNELLRANRLKPKPPRQKEKSKNWYVVAGTPATKNKPEVRVNQMYYDEKGIPVQFREHMLKKKADTEHKDYLLSLCDALAISYSRIKNAAPHGRTILGRHGDIQSQNGYWYLYVEAKSKRHLSGIKRKLAFMELVTDMTDAGEFKLDRMPTTTEAETIRNVLGIKKSKGKGVPELEGSFITEGFRNNDSVSTL